MKRRDQASDIQALRDECALAGAPMTGDEDIATLFGALRHARDCPAAPLPSTELSLILERGIDPARRRSRSAMWSWLRYGRRLAATGLTVKILVGGVVTAGVATASMVGSLPGEAIVRDTIDVITPDIGDDGHRHRTDGSPSNGTRPDVAVLRPVLAAEAFVLPASPGPQQSGSSGGDAPAPMTVEASVLPPSPTTDDYPGLLGPTVDEDDLDVLSPKPEQPKSVPKVPKGSGAQSGSNGSDTPEDARGNRVANSNAGSSGGGSDHSQRGQHGKGSAGVHADAGSSDAGGTRAGGNHGSVDGGHAGSNDNPGANGNGGSGQAVGKPVK